MQELLSSIQKNAIGLAIFAVVTAGTIAAAKTLTHDRIEQNILKAKTAALNEILPQAQYNNDLLHDTLLLKDISSVRLLGPIAENAVAWRARTLITNSDSPEQAANDATKSVTAHSVLLPVSAPDGYTTKIDLVVGIKHDGTVLGVRVIEHKETPGLGDKIELKKSDWILSFNGTSLTMPAANKWAVKKDDGHFDQFSGATITPRAVVNAVKNALDFFAQNKKLLLAASVNNSTEQEQF